MINLNYPSKKYIGVTIFNMEGIQIIPYRRVIYEEIFRYIKFLYRNISGDMGST